MNQTFKIGALVTTLPLKTLCLYDVFCNNQILENWSSQFMEPLE